MDMLHNPSFWVAVSFVIFVAMAYKKAAAMLAGSLDARSERIRKELEQAESLRKEAEQVLAEYKRKQAEYLKEAEAMLEKARKDAGDYRQAAERELKTSLDARMKSALERIALEEQKAIQDVRAHVVDITLAAARAMLSEQANKGSHGELIKLALADIERKVH